MHTGGDGAEVERHNPPAFGGAGRQHFLDEQGSTALPAPGKSTYWGRCDGTGTVGAPVRGSRTVGGSPKVNGHMGRRWSVVGLAAIAGVRVPVSRSRSQVVAGWS